MSTSHASISRGLAIASFVFTASCASSSRFEVGPTPYHNESRSLLPASSPKRLRVAVASFKTSWGADVLGAAGGPSLSQRAARVVEEELAGVPRVELDRTSFEAAAAVELRGELVGDTRGVKSVRLALTGPQGETIQIATRECAAGAELDVGALRAAARELVPALEGLRWSCSAIETSHRYLVIAAGGESGLTVGEKLVVRKRTPRGAAAPEQGEEVARVIVDAFSQLEGGRSVAYCRLWGGSISGFDPRELVVVEILQ